MARVVVMPSSRPTVSAGRSGSGTPTESADGTPTESAEGGVCVTGPVCRPTVGDVDLIETLRSTGAAREFRPDPVPDDVLARVLDTARFAPSGGNRQAWR